MLTKLKRLSFDVEGRYATPQELQFLHDYLDTADDRISLYEKLSEMHTSLDTQLEGNIKALDPNVYHRNHRDVSAVCKRDRQHALRCISSAMLLDDLNRLKDDYLVWTQILVRTFREQYPVNITYQALLKTLETVLTEAELTLIASAVQLTRNTLTA